MVKLFVNNFYENASALDWDFDGEVLSFVPWADHERFGGNYQVSCWNFKLLVPEDSIGQTITLRLKPAYCKWNGEKVIAFRSESLTCVISSDQGKTWASQPMTARELKLTLDAPEIQIANLVPYTETDLNKMLNRISSCPDCHIETIGHTVEKRPLEIIKIGDAPDSVFLRGRAHPWESGGSWLIDGLVDFICSGSPEAERIMDKVSFRIMPMAAKDGVCRGMTRFTVSGFDLNRNWNKTNELSADLCPENACLVEWFKQQAAAGTLPRLAICIHNDSDGKLHLAHPDDNGKYLKRMHLLEKSLRNNSCFAEGIRDSAFINPGTFGEGIVARFGVDALIWELNAYFAVGLGRAPLHNDWIRLGRDFAATVYEYFKSL